MSKLIKKPIITEKTLNLANEQNVYTFEVAFKAAKPQIKSEIEELFEVEVERVNTIVAPSKRRRVGSRRIQKLNTVQKKALVKLAPGQKIELFDISE